MSDAPVVPGLALVPLDGGGAERLAAFCRRATDFFELVGGMPGGPETAADILAPLAAHITPGTIHRFGLESDGDLIGVLELLEGYPTADIWYVGLLVLVPDRRRSGLGSSVWAGARDWIQSRGGTWVRLIVQQQNTGARAFWEGRGFSIEKELVARNYALESRCWRMSRAV
ncbi:MAG TPA: GNAT family N-acetyltransferase [Polyangia bacterium]|nr:GNAT family N-acetyltransferase [Polyangia bacterium]